MGQAGRQYPFLYEKLQEELKDIYEHKMSDMQFEKFAFDWIGEEALLDYISSAIESTTDLNVLKEWVKDANRYLKYKTENK